MPLPALSSYRNRPPGALPYVPDGPLEDWDADGGGLPDFSWDDAATKPNRSARSFAGNPEASGSGEMPPPPRPSSNPDAMKGLKKMPGDDAPPPPPPNAGAAMPPPPPPPQEQQDDPPNMPPPPTDEDADAAPPPPPTRRGQPQSAFDRLSALAPPPAPKPRWYNKLAAGLAGAAGGYMQARYPGRVNPATVQAAESNLMAPGYARQRGQYEQQRGDLQDQLKNELQVENVEGLKDQRAATAEQRRLLGLDYADREAAKRTAAADRQKSQDDALKQRDLASQRTAFGKLVGKHEPVYVDPGEPIPPGFTALTDPDVKGKVALVPAGMRAAPKELVEAGLLPGIQTGQQTPTDMISKATDAFYALKKQSEKPVRPPASTEVELARVATDPDENPERRAGAEAALKRLDKSRQSSRTSINITAPGLSGAPSKLSGDEYLASLPPGAAGQVRAIAEGRAQIPSGSTRSQAAQDLRNAVFTYDPSFSDQRAQIRKAFTSGNDGRNIGALNTATVHLDQFAEAAKAMANGSFRPGNDIYNRIRAAFGNSAPTNFESLKSAVAGEMASALKGNATDVEIANMSRNLQSANSPQQLSDAVETNLHVLGAKLNTYQERYRQQMPDDKTWSPVLPSARAVYEKHGVDPTAGPARQGGGTGAPPPAPAGPRAGDTRQYAGATYRFDGTVWRKQ